MTDDQRMTDDHDALGPHPLTYVMLEVRDDLAFLTEGSGAVW